VVLSPRSLFKLGADGNKKIVEVIEEETALERLYSRLNSVELRIEVLEYYEARYNNVPNNPWIPEYRIEQIRHRE